MPYGIDKKQGGDSPSNVKFVEKCVAKISGNNKRTGKPYTKSEKIAICKSQLKKNKAKASVDENYDVDNSTLARFLAYRAVFMHDRRKEGLTYAQAETMWEKALNVNSYNLNENLLGR